MDELMLPEELTPNMRHVLGYPNFRCGAIARKLRQQGWQIPERAEDEQAVVIHWLLKLVLRHGENWCREGNRVLFPPDHERIKAECPGLERGGKGAKCCSRAGEYNGYASGPLLFVCPKDCSCHD
jgi:hypothetical protein